MWTWNETIQVGVSTILCTSTYTCACNCSSGNVYKGDWHDSHRHGHGTMYWKDKGEQYTGDWVNGIQVY